MVFEDPAVEHHAVEFSVEHALNVVRIFEVLRLYQDIFTIGLRPRLRIFRIDDDGAEHAAGNVLDHGRGAAMIEKDAWLLRDEGVADGFAGVDRSVVV